jgi:hypothetical protein
LCSLAFVLLVVTIPPRSADTNRDGSGPTDPFAPAPVSTSGDGSRKRRPRS